MDNEQLKDWRAMQTQLALHRQNLRWKARFENEAVSAYLYEASNFLNEAYRTIDRAILEASAKED